MSKPLLILIGVIICLTIILVSQREHLSIRRWRSPVPHVGQFTAPDGTVIRVEPRQVADDWWAMNYDSGRGFQLA